MSAALQTIGLHKRFGGLVATNDVTLTLAHGARHALIGPNGAGKTTFVNQLTGVLAPDAGQVLLGGVDITREPVADRARRGLGRAFQLTNLFPQLTALENVRLAVQSHADAGWSRPDHYGWAAGLLLELGVTSLAELGTLLVIAALVIDEFGSTAL